MEGGRWEGERDPCKKAKKVEEDELKERLAGWDPCKKAKKVEEDELKEGLAVDGGRKRVGREGSVKKSKKGRVG
jgi:hypothetical protein